MYGNNWKVSVKHKHLLLEDREQVEWKHECLTAFSDCLIMIVKFTTGLVEYEIRGDRFPQSASLLMEPVSTILRQKANTYRNSVTLAEKMLKSPNFEIIKLLYNPFLIVSRAL